MFNKLSKYNVIDLSKDPYIISSFSDPYEAQDFMEYASKRVEKVAIYTLEEGKAAFDNWINIVKEFITR